MKVTLGPYRSFFGPYQLAEKLCFWAKKEKDEYGFESNPDWVHNFGEWLAHGSVDPQPTPDQPYRICFEERPKTLLYRLLLWIDSKKQRKIRVRIDPWDIYSMDHTLAFIVVPMLRQLATSKHGAPHVEDEDVPVEIRKSSAKPLTEAEQEVHAVDEFYFERWNWVLREMIFAFESKLDDSWKEKYHKGKTDLRMRAVEFDEEGNPKLYQLERGPDDTSSFDAEGMESEIARISNGFRLFGKYYESLWS